MITLEGEVRLYPSGVTPVASWNWEHLDGLGCQLLVPRDRKLSRSTYDVCRELRHLLRNFGGAATCTLRLEDQEDPGNSVRIELSGPHAVDPKVDPNAALAEKRGEWYFQWVTKCVPLGDPEEEEG